MFQGLKHADLLVLKRALHRKDAAGMQSNAASPSKSESALVEPIISRRSGAFCFAFANSGRSQEYLVGEEQPSAADALPAEITIMSCSLLAREVNGKDGPCEGTVYSGCSCMCVSNSFACRDGGRRHTLVLDHHD